MFLLCCCSVAQSCPTLYDPMDSTPGFPVHHHPELAQTHVHWVSDTIQLLSSLSSPSPPAFNLSQRQGLFQWVSSLHQVGKVLELQLRHQSFQWIFRPTCFPLGLTDLISLQPKGLSRVFSNTQLSSQSNSHIHTWLLEKPWPWLDGPLLAK